MKRTVPFAIVVLLAVVIAFVAVDQTGAMASKQNEPKEMKCKGAMHKEMMEHRPMPMMCPMHAMMCEHMMKKEIIAMPDGDVVVMAGNKLYKYDKDFNLIKEVELKAEQEMKEKMEKMQNETFKRDARELIRLKHLVSLDGNIVFHKKIYEELTNSIMRLFDGRDKISISEAKEATGLSRKYLIPLLNRIERDG